MKIQAIILLCGLTVWSVTPLLAYEPLLKDGVLIQDGAVPLEVDRYPIPCVVDWNNDGAKDLLVGQYIDGWIWLFLNQGTDLNPVFDGGSLIESGGQPISVPSG